MPPTPKAPKAKKPVKAKAEANQLPVIYPEVKPTLCLGGEALTAARAKAILGWETQAEYKERIASSGQSDLPDDAVAFADYLLTDEHGQPVKCWNNLKNRPFDEAHCRKLAQDILNRHWADSRNGEHMTINGETVIISRTGQVHSAQHRLAALVLASQMWAKDKHWAKLWETEPTMECLVVTGISDDPKVVQTLDNVKPRSQSDVFFTSGMFDKLNPTERKECSRMLEAAVNLFWRRTGAGADAHNHYQSHSESVGLVERHRGLLDCVKHIFEENRERAISKLRLSPGQSACMMYLMATGKSDPAKYRDGKAPTEKKLNLDLWEKAEEFWSLVGSGTDFSPLRTMLGRLVDEDSLLGGRQIEKITLIAKAWGLFLAGTPFDEGTEQDGSDSNLALDYREKNGTWRLVSDDTFGGIDQGQKVTSDEADGEDPTPEQLAEAKAKRVEELEAKAKGKAEAKAPANLVDELAAYREQYPNKLLIFKGSKGGKMFVYGSDAKDMIKLNLAKMVGIQDGMSKASFDMGALPKVLAALKKERIETEILG